VSVDFRVLLAPGSAEGEDRTAGAPGDRITLEDLLDALSLGRRVERPYVLLNMICTADGRATIEGRSGPLGSPTDAALFNGLRTLVDGVLVGAQTLRTERYNRLVADATERTRRLARGLGEEPLACVVSASLALDPRIPILADPAARVALLTPSEGTLPSVAAHTFYVRACNDGRLDLRAALATLRERFAVRTLLCEGGPHLAGQLLAAGLLDELFLTFAPKLAAGDVVSEAAGGQRQPALSIVSGPPLEPPVQLELASLLESDSYLFLRYRVRR
jgi:riboflavin biosynthesis pyrimidine reductase